MPHHNYYFFGQNAAGPGTNEVPAANLAMDLVPGGTATRAGAQRRNGEADPAPMFAAAVPISCAREALRETTCQPRKLATIDSMRSRKPHPFGPSSPVGLFLV